MAGSEKVEKSERELIWRRGERVVGWFWWKAEPTCPELQLFTTGREEVAAVPQVLRFVPHRSFSALLDTNNRTWCQIWMNYKFHSDRCNWKLIVIELSVVELGEEMWSGIGIWQWWFKSVFISVRYWWRFLLGATGNECSTGAGSGVFQWGELAAKPRAFGRHCQVDQLTEFLRHFVCLFGC